MWRDAQLRYRGEVVLKREGARLISKEGVFRLNVRRSTLAEWPSAFNSYLWHDECFGDGSIELKVWLMSVRMIPLLLPWSEVCNYNSTFVMGRGSLQHQPPFCFSIDIKWTLDIFTELEDSMEIHTLTQRPRPERQIVQQYTLSLRLFWNLDSTFLFFSF